MEKEYQNALFVEIEKNEIKAEKERSLKVFYESKIVGDYVRDIVVEDRVIVKLIAVNEIAEIHEVQLVNYLKGTGNEIGLLINFGPSFQIKRKYILKQNKVRHRNENKT